MANTPIHQFTDTPKAGIPVTATPITQVDLPPEQLMKALYWIWDAFERANMVFFLVGDTAEQAIKNHDLLGDSVHVGIRRKEWNSGARRVLDNYIGIPVTETEDVSSYLHEGVPVFIHLYEDDPTITAPDAIMYKYEYFKIPNTFAQFKELHNG